MEKSRNLELVGVSPVLVLSPVSLPAEPVTAVATAAAESANMKETKNNDGKGIIKRTTSPDCSGVEPKHITQDTPPAISVNTS